jgi:hypothetical protein
MTVREQAKDRRADVLTRAEFLTGLRAALAGRTGYATGKLGLSEIFRLKYSVATASPDTRRALLKVLEPTLIFHCLNQHALFPPDPRFYLRFNEVTAGHLRALDCVGGFPHTRAMVRSIADFYDLRMPFIDFLDQEPDRSVPADEARCYLPDFRGRRLLIVCSFAELLRQRASREVFEGVWARTGKRWFYPAAVDALEFPYGYSAATHARYATSLDLFDEVAAEMARRDFDVALIAAAGLGIPLAAHAKSLGRVGIALGGALQVLFGVLGRRWRADPEWMGRYVNDRWIDMPARYRPPERNIADGGAYW